MYIVDSIYLYKSTLYMNPQIYIITKAPGVIIQYNLFIQILYLQTDFE